MGCSDGEIFCFIFNVLIFPIHKPPSCLSETNPVSARCQNVSSFDDLLFLSTFRLRGFVFSSPPATRTAHYPILAPTFVLFIQILAQLAHGHQPLENLQVYSALTLAEVPLFDRVLKPEMRGWTDN